MSEATALVKRTLEGPIEEFTESRIALVARTVAPPGTTPDELALFLGFCQARGLNPLLRQVYLLKDKDGRVSIVTGIDGLRLIAQRTSEYEGQEGPQWKSAPDTEWSDTPPEDGLYACRVGVWRKGFRRPLWATVKLSSFARDGKNWRDRPEHQLAIRAESHALRRSFPAETSGLSVSYDSDGQETSPEVVNPDAPLTNAQLGELHRLSKVAGWSDDERHFRAGVSSFTEISKGRAAQLIDEWRALVETPREDAEPASAARAAPVTAVDAEPPSAPAVRASEDGPDRSNTSGAHTVAGSALTGKQVAPGADPQDHKFIGKDPNGSCERCGYMLEGHGKQGQLA